MLIEQEYHQIIFHPNQYLKPQIQSQNNNQFNSNNYFLQILISNHSVADHIFSFLHKKQKLNILVICKLTYNILKGRILHQIAMDKYFRLNQYILSEFFQIQNPFYQQSQIVNNQNSLQYQLINNPIKHHQQKNNIQLIQIAQKIHKNTQKFTLSLNSYISLSDSNQISNILSQIISFPNLPLPTLRRQTIGTYCNSSLQIMMAQRYLQQRDNQENEMQWREQSLKNLQLSLLQKMDKEILEELRSNWERAVKIYNRGIQCNQGKYFIQKQMGNEDRDGDFLCMIQSMIQSIEFYSQGIELIISQKMIKNEEKKHKKQDLLGFVQFNLRYNNYRNIILQIQSKFHFIFKIFDLAFQVVLNQKLHSLQNQLSSDQKPQFTPWRIMLKTWIQKTNNLYSYNSSSFISLFLFSRYQQLQQLLNKSFTSNIQQQIFSFSKSILYNFSKRAPFYQGYDIQIPLLSKSFVNYLLRNYQEYLVDCCCNQISIPWIGSSQLYLGSSNGIYQNHQKKLIQRYGSYISFIHNFCEEDKLNGQEFQVWFYNFQLKSINDLIKSTTIKKLLQNIFIPFLCNKRQIKSTQLQLVLQQLNQIDKYIEYLNKQRNIWQLPKQNQNNIYEVDKGIIKVIQNEDDMMQASLSSTSTASSVSVSGNVINYENQQYYLRKTLMEQDLDQQQVQQIQKYGRIRKLRKLL